MYKKELKQIEEIKKHIDFKANLTDHGWLIEIKNQKNNYYEVYGIFETYNEALTDLLDFTKDLDS